MAEQRSLEINVISAKDLQDVNLMTKMDVYAVVSISGDPNSRQKVKTNVDHGCGTNPTWNFPVRLSVDDSLAQSNRLTLVFRLVCDRSLGDKDVGEVNIPIKELLDSFAAVEGNSGNGSMKFVSYQVRKPSGKPKGELNFSYKFGEKVAGKPAAGEPAKAYPAAMGPSYPPPPVVGYNHAHGPPPFTGYAGYPPPQPPPPAPPLAQEPPYGGVGYPPPPPGYGYPPPPHPPPQGYGYAYPAPAPAPPPPGYGYGYGYPQPPPPQGNNKSKFGLGLGAGLLGGAVGGLLIGDMVSDAGAYDAGYDAGFDDAGGFGF